MKHTLPDPHPFVRTSENALFSAQTSNSVDRAVRTVVNIEEVTKIIRVFFLRAFNLKRKMRQGHTIVRPGISIMGTLSLML